MIKVIMHGCNGAMGQTISKIIEAEAEMEIVAGIDLFSGQNSFPVFQSMEACTVQADVVIDFSSARVVDGLLESCMKKNLPVVLCSTGLSKEQIEKTEAASKKIPILRSANMSYGVNLLLKMLKDAAVSLAGAGFDIEIVEKHHNQKLDAPSGTAVALADSMNEALDHAYAYQYDRSRERKKRDKKEIGISSVRGGTIVGEHEVIFAGTDEVIEFKHTAYSKAIFAKGSVQAAKFLAGKPAGLYEMSDVIEAAAK